MSEIIPKKPEKIKITALSIADAARVLSSVYRRNITEDQIRMIAQGGNLIGVDDTINLVAYIAYLVREMADG